MGRFYTSPDWRFVITDLGGGTLTFLDRLASNRECMFTLNAPSQFTCDVPADNPEVNLGSTGDDPLVSMNDRLIYGFRREAPGGSAPPWVCRGGWLLMQPNDEVSATSDAPLTHITGFDPWQYAKMRPVVNDSGVLPGTSGLTITGPGGTVAKTLLLNTIAGATPGSPFATANCYIDCGQTPYYGGTIETTMPSYTFIFKQGMMLGDAWTQIASSGDCDIVLTPIYDPVNRPGFLAELSVYELAGSVRADSIFAWDMPGRSVLGMNRLEDGSQMINVGQGYLGQGGDPVTVQTNAASVAKFGDYWWQQFFPTLSDPSLAPYVEGIMAAKVGLAAQGRQTIVVDLAPEFAPIPFQDYVLGDQVPLYASRNFRKPINPVLSGSEWTKLHRIYAIPVAIPDDSPETVTQLLLSPPSG